MKSLFSTFMKRFSSWGPLVMLILISYFTVLLGTFSLLTVG